MVNYTMAKYDVRPVSETSVQTDCVHAGSAKQAGQKDQIQFWDEVRIYTRISEFNG